MPGSKGGKKKSSGAAGNGDRFTESARARGLSTISKAKAERSIAYAKRLAKRLETLRRKSALERWLVCVAAVALPLSTPSPFLSHDIRPTPLPIGLL
jgi:hypothetical protein